MTSKWTVMLLIVETGTVFGVEGLSSISVELALRSLWCRCQGWSLKLSSGLNIQESLHVGCHSYIFCFGDNPSQEAVGQGS